MTRFLDWLLRRKSPIGHCPYCKAKLYEGYMVHIRECEAYKRWAWGDKK
jgi:hypothetical protein